MKRKFRLIAGLLIGGLVAATAWMLTRPTKATGTSTVSAAPTPTTINAIGRIEPAGAVRAIAAPTGIEGSRIARLLVQEGDMVRAAQPLFELDSQPRQAASIAQAEAAVRSSEARLLQVKAGAKAAEIAAQQAIVERLSEELAVARSLAERAEPLYRGGDLSRKEYDARCLAVKTLDRELARAGQQLEGLRQYRAEDAAVAESEIAAAQAALRRARTDMATGVIRAPVAGAVLRIYNREGESGSNRVLDLAATNRMSVVAEVYESDVRRLRTGQRASIQLPALRETVEGTVEAVGRQLGKRELLTSDPVVADADSRVIRVRIELDEAASRRVANLTNMQVEVRIAQ
jgi:HlyD family secretion protein